MIILPHRGGCLDVLKSVSRNSYFLEGWALLPKQMSFEAPQDIVMRNGGEFKKLDVIFRTRDDVSNSYGLSIATLCGFSATLNCELLEDFSLFGGDSNNALYPLEPTPESRLFERFPSLLEFRRRTDNQKQNVHRTINMTGDSTPIRTGFVTDKASAQNALNVFSSGWSSSMPTASGLVGGDAFHFDDVRVPWAASALGGIAGKSILELGPFEGYNTFQFEQLGAGSVISIENSVTNFLKCLVIKNLFGIRSTFMLGDFIQYLEENKQNFDIIWASGVLYHMAEPIRFLEAMSKRSDSLFIWTHYFDKTKPSGMEFFCPEKNEIKEFKGRPITLHYRSYNLPGQNEHSYSGGKDVYSFWLEKDDLEFVLKTLGYSRIQMAADHPNNISGPACYFLAHRDTSSSS